MFQEEINSISRDIMKTYTSKVLITNSRFGTAIRSWCKFQENQNASLWEKWVEWRLRIGEGFRSREAECISLFLCFGSTWQSGPGRRGNFFFQPLRVISTMETTKAGSRSLNRPGSGVGCLLTEVIQADDIWTFLLQSFIVTKVSGYKQRW